MWNMYAFSAWSTGGVVRCRTLDIPLCGPGSISHMPKTAFDTIRDIVKRIPEGRVATYGQISRMLDGKYSAQFVGWALHASVEGVPWHRVINSKGGVSTRRVLGYAPDLQRHLLEAEGIVFEDDRCDLARYQWDGRRARKKRGPAD